MGRKILGIPFVLALIAAAALGVAGCGDDGGSAPDDLAALLPADAAIYYEQTLLPTDEQKESIESIAAKFPDGDQLGSMLEMAFDESLAEQGMSFSEDIKPWLGSRAVAVSSELGPGGLPFAGVAEITDSDLAEEKLGELAGSEGEVSEEDYEGETYSVGTDGDGGMLAYAVRDDFVLAASTQEGIEGLLDVEADRADSLADSDAGTQLMEAAGSVGGEQPLQATAVDVETIVDLLAENAEVIELPLEQIDQLRDQLEQADLDGAVSYGIGVTENDSVAIDISFPSSDAYSGESSDLLGELPADSFFALAVAGIDGDAFADGFDFGFSQSSGTDVSPESLEAQLGFDIRELAATLTDFSLFARGTDLPSLGGAFVAGIDDSGPALEAVEGVREVIDDDPTVDTEDLSSELADLGEGFAVQTPGGPPINVVVSDDQLVVGAGDEATVRAFEPGEPLGDEGISAAEDTLGEGFAPTLILDSPQALELAQALGAGTDPGFEEALPYLEPLGTLAAGSKQEDGRAIGRLALSFEE